MGICGSREDARRNNITKFRRTPTISPHLSLKESNSREYELRVWIDGLFDRYDPATGNVLLKD